MSLILEALKKSEAERRLGETPSLSTLPVWKPQSRTSRAWWLLLPALAIAAAAAWSNRDLLSGRELAGDVPLPALPAGKPVVVAPAPGAQPAAQQTQPATNATPVRANDAPMPAPDSAPSPSPPPQQLEVAFAGQSMPDPLPQRMDDLDAMKGISPENQARIRSGELVVPRPVPLAEPGSTQQTPIVTADSAPLPPPSGPDDPGQLPINKKASLAQAPSNPVPTASPAAVVATRKEPSNPGVDTTSVPSAPTPDASGPAPNQADSVPLIYDLTLRQRQGLPALKMSMHVYHRDAARRFVIIDGLRVGEDGVLGQQLWVRRIVPEGVVIEYNDTRFLLPRLGG